MKPIVGRPHSINNVLLGFKRVPAIVPKLEDDESHIRFQAVSTLEVLRKPGLLSEAVASALAQRYANAVRELEVTTDRGHRIRQHALETLQCMPEPELIAKHAAAVFACFTDEEPYVRLKAIRTLSMLEPAIFVRYAAAVAAKLEGDDHLFVQDSAKAAIRKLEKAGFVGSDGWETWKEPPPEFVERDERRRRVDAWLDEFAEEQRVQAQAAQT